MPYRDAGDISNGFAIGTKDLCRREPVIIWSISAAKKRGFLMKRLIVLGLFAFGCLVPGADATVEQWMHSPTPQQLRLGTFFDDDCPMSSRDMRTLVENVLTEARIDPVPSRADPPFLYLRISVECKPNERLGVWAYDLHINFARFLWEKDLGLYNGIGGSEYAWIDIGDSEDLYRTIRNGTKMAANDYRNVNFTTIENYAD